MFVPRSRSLLLFVPVAIMTAATAQADIRVSFDEGAPKDRFRIENTGTCAVSAGDIVLDLSTSNGQLIFDVTAAGAGVEVFQPFDVVSGADALSDIPVVIDGQSRLSLSLIELAPNASVSFTIDVDDTIGQREITVSGSEINGASVSYVAGDAVMGAVFGTNATAEIITTACS